jgi:hypothetical protein
MTFTPSSVELGREAADPFGLCHITDLDGDVPAFHIAELAQALAECVDRSRRRGRRATRRADGSPLRLP